MNDQDTIKSKDKAFPKWRYLTFGAGDVGYALIYFWIASYLTYFYTDIFGVPVMTVTVMMLITRIFDAVNDPIIGGLLDNGKGKMGRYRPWIIVGGIGMAISAVFMFWAHPEWPLVGKVIYMYATYILCTIAMTIFYMAYAALGSTISADSHVRTRAASVRFGFSGVGNLAIGFVVPMFLASLTSFGEENSYLIGLMLSGVVAIPFILLTGLGTKEVITPPLDEKSSFKQKAKALFSNKPMLIISAAFLLQGTCVSLRMTTATYYFTYLTGDMGQFSIYNLLLGLASIAGALTAIYVYKFLRDKAKALAVILVVMVISLVGMYLFPAPNPIFMVLAAVSGYSNGAVPALTYAMLPDAIDYTHHKDRIRIDGFLSSFASFAFKCGMALSSLLVGIILTTTGYVANTAQNGAALEGISLMMTIIPAVLLALIIVLMVIYPLNENKHKKIVAELKEQGHLE